MIRPILVAALVASLSLGCKKTGPAAADNAEPALIAGAAPGPAGYKWQRLPAQGGLGSVEVPDGPGWSKAASEGVEVSHDKLDITVMIKTQPDVGADARAEYMQSLTDVNKRDAPKYQVMGRQDGSVARQVAGRLDGKFDNGTKYSTRDYVLFANNGAFLVMVRGPVASEADVRAVADHVAQSFQ